MARDTFPFSLSSTEIRAILDQLGKLPRKQLGQSFLQSKPTIDRILDLCDLKRDDEILEIGPGLGALTFTMAARVKHVHAIEIDPAFSQFLQDKCQSLDIDNVDIISSDALAIEYPPMMNKIISAVPYSISAPLTFKILEYLRLQPALACLIFQKEFSEKILAKPGTMTYGRISASVSLLADVVPLLEISRNNFFPVPRVDSMLLRISPRPSIDADIAHVCMDLLRGVFPFKNKMLKKAIAMFLGKESSNASKANIETMPFGDKRVRELDRDDFLALARWYSTIAGG